MRVHSWKTPCSPSFGTDMAAARCPGVAPLSIRRIHTSTAEVSQGLSDGWHETRRIIKVCKATQRILRKNLPSRQYGRHRNRQFEQVVNENAALVVAEDFVCLLY